MNTFTILNKTVLFKFNQVFYSTGQNNSPYMPNFPYKHTHIPCLKALFSGTEIWFFLLNLLFLW